MTQDCNNPKCKTKHIDYSHKMPHLDFEYDDEYYPRDDELPDPQIDPVIPGAAVPLDKVGVSGVDLPVQMVRRDGTVQTLHATTSLYGSLDDPKAKGLNLSRFPIVMHEALENNLSLDGMKIILDDLRSKQGSKDIYCKMKFKYPWTQEALRTRKELDPREDGREWSEDDPEVFMIDGDKILSHEKAEGHIFYDCELEGQHINDEYKYYLTVHYIYSSTCPCSFELAQHAMQTRNKAANGHSQRSVAKIKVQFDPSNILYIEDVVEKMREIMPTETVVICKRRDEMAFAERNGSNPVFVEDFMRIAYEALDTWFDEGRIFDFYIVSDHLESLHNWSATAVTSKGIPGGLR